MTSVTRNQTLTTKRSQGQAPPENLAKNEKGFMELETNRNRKERLNTIQGGSLNPNIVTIQNGQSSKLTTDIVRHLDRLDIFLETGTQIDPSMAREQIVSNSSDQHHILTTSGVTIGVSELPNPAQSTKPIEGELTTKDNTCHRDTTRSDLRRPR